MDVLGLQIVSLSGLIATASREVKGDEQFGHRQPFLEQDDDVTSAPDPLSNPQPCRSLVEVHCVA